MTFRQARLKFPDGQMMFFFPLAFSAESIIEAIRTIRLGDRRNWRREFRELEVEVTEPETPEIHCEYKYIVLHAKAEGNNDRYMVVFPKAINHDFMLEVVQMAVFDNEFPVGLDPIKVFSAGFVSGGTCGGHSETLNRSSDKGDTELFKNTFKRKGKQHA